MELYAPCTVDLLKHQTSEQRYGLEHINRLLEDELSQLRTLKNQKANEHLPRVKNQARKSPDVDGLNVYQRRAEQVCSRDCSFVTEERQLSNLAPTELAPFAEIPQDFPKDARVVSKGKMPFFKLSSDGHSLPCGLPKLSGKRKLNYSSDAIKKMLDEGIGAVKQDHNSPKNGRCKQLSRKLVRARLRVTQEPFTDNSDNEDLTNSLRIQYCSMRTRDSFGQEIHRAKSKRALPARNNHRSKTFTLACTRNSYKFSNRNEQDSNFFASSDFLHSHLPQNVNSEEKVQRMSDRKAQVEEKTALPRLEKEVPGKTKMAKESREKCRKRSEQVEQNKIALGTATPTLKHEIKNDCLERKTKSNILTKEKKDTLLASDEKEEVLPLLECTAYMDKDGSLFLLPGAFTLRKNDYNIWSRKRKTSAKPVRNNTILQTGSLPTLVHQNRVG